MKRRDESTLLALVGSAYQAAADPAAWEPFLRQVAKATRSEAGGILYQKVTREGQRTVVRPLRRRAVDMDPALARRYVECPEIVTSNPWNAALAPDDPVGSIVFSDTIVGDRVLQRSAFYQEILRPQGFYYAVNLVAGRAGDQTSNLNLVRPRRAGPFGREEARLLGLLTPHLTRALMIEQRLGGAALRAETLEQVLSSIATAVFVVDEMAHVLLLNLAAEGLLARRDGLQVQRGVLQPTLLGDVVARAARHGEGGALLLPRPSGAPALTAQVLPLAGGVRDGVPAAVLLVSDRDGPEVEATVLRKLYGLTGAEAQVAVALVNGRTVEETCADLSISSNTVRTHLKRIFAKTGTKRQAELVRALLPLARTRHPSR